MIIDRSQSNIGLNTGHPSAVDSYTLLSKTQDQFMTSNKFVGAQQSGTFISLGKDGKPVPTTATPNIGIGYVGLAPDDLRRKPYSKIMLNTTTQSGFLEDSKSEKPMIVQGSNIEGGSSEMMRMTGFMTNRTRNISTVSANDKSRLKIPSSIDLNETLTMMIDQEMLQSKFNKGSTPMDTSQPSVHDQENALMQMRLKENLRDKHDRVFDKRKRSQAVNPTKVLDDISTASIPQGSPRAARLSKQLDSPERSNKMSHVISYRGKPSGSLPPLSANSKALADKLISRKVNHAFNMDFNNANVQKYYELQNRNKQEL